MSGSRGIVLVVEDSPAMATLTEVLLREEGFQPRLAGSATEALDAFAEEKPIAVLVDWVLPDTSGSELCKVLRERDPLLPILFVTGRDDEATIARAMDAGADDFLVKPVRPRELVARLEAHVRKAEAGRAASTQKIERRAADEPKGAPGIHGTGELLVDEDARTVRVGAHEIRLGALEFEVLAYLSRNAGRALSRDQILTNVYGFETEIATERVDVLVRRLRAKLGSAGRMLSAVPGYGYRLERGPQRLALPDQVSA